MDRRISRRGLTRATLARQGLIERFRGPVADVVGRLAGLQAQHANAPYVALWARRHDQTIADLEAALDDRTVVKATLMRSTLHLVAAGDFSALDAAAAAGRMALWWPSARRTGVDLADLHAALLAYCARPRTVAEIEAHLASIAPTLAGPALPAGVRNTAFRMASAAGGLVHVPPSGRWREHGKPSYLDARAWLGDAGTTSEPERALTTAIERYLTAYGPASLGDIGKWVGQPRITVLRNALASLGDRIVRSIGDDGRDLVDLAGLPPHASPDAETTVPARFLSRWDSVLIAYDVRDRILPDAYRAAVIKKNGDFLPTFLVDGLVAGLWSVEVAAGEAVLTLTPFAAVPRTERRMLEEEGERLVRYVEAEASRHAVRWATG